MLGVADISSSISFLKTPIYYPFSPVLYPFKINYFSPLN